MIGKESLMIKVSCNEDKCFGDNKKTKVVERRKERDVSLKDEVFSLGDAIVLVNQISAAANGQTNWIK